MVDLDDAAALAALDAGDMLGTVAALPEHVAAGYAAGLATDRSARARRCHVGRVLRDGRLRGRRRHLAADLPRPAPVPVDVNRTPVLPEYAGPHTLAIVSSFSGGTARDARRRSRRRSAAGAGSLAITSGGRAGELCAASTRSPMASVPGGLPAACRPRPSRPSRCSARSRPRGSCRRSPTTSQDAADVDAARRAGSAPTSRSPTTRRRSSPPGWATAVAVVWGAEGIGAVAAMRWKTQINENGKVPAWHAAMSELDHNEVVGWVPPYGERCTP